MVSMAMIKTSTQKLKDNSLTLSIPTPK